MAGIGPTEIDDPTALHKRLCVLWIFVVKLLCQIKKIHHDEREGAEREKCLRNTSNYEGVGS